MSFRAQINLKMCQQIVPCDLRIALWIRHLYANCSDIDVYKSYKEGGKSKKKKSQQILYTYTSESWKEIVI